AAAARHQAVNLGQGYPDADGPAELLEAAAHATLRGPNQYAPGSGRPDLREAIADHRARLHGVREDPASQILITTGATEAITAAVLALVQPGDEVVTVDPFYDSHAAATGMAGGVHVRVPVHPPHFLPRFEDLEAAFTARTRLLILNTPHNPTGAVYPRPLLGAILAACTQRGILILTDEVYEHLVYEGEHVTMRALPGAQDCVLTASSAGKSFAVTGWKIGWLVGSAALIARVRAVKQYLSFSSGPAYQEAVAGFLPRCETALEQQRERYRAGRDRLSAGLRELGLQPLPSPAGYFTLVDLRPWGIDNVAAALDELIERAGVAMIPVSALSARDDGSLDSWARLAYCKDPEVIDEALRRLQQWRETHAAS
ncbi:MAG: aminotransferase class I/II-fold pyridoxal phosphate-dependent enzyme, partial [Micrococcus sp.]|nr:aminotransferase class I/II-fold pyridoxal phosphate-dependent enzyme [Micrococcus sp.]